MRERRSCSATWSSFPRRRLPSSCGCPRTSCAVAPTACGCSSAAFWSVASAPDAPGFCPKRRFSSRFASTRSGMPVRVRHPQARDGIALEVELDQDRRLLADDPAVVARLDGDELWRLELDRAAVGVLDVDLSPGEETDVCMFAEVGSDDRLNVYRPAESGRIDDPLHASIAGAPDVEHDMADLAVLGSVNPGEEWIGRVRSAPSRLAPPRCMAGPLDSLALCRRHVPPLRCASRGNAPRGYRCPGPSPIAPAARRSRRSVC